MSEVEKLRELLREAREWVELNGEAGCPADQCEQCAMADEMLKRIDAALAEPVGPGRDCICTGPWTTGNRHTEICREFCAMRAECQRQMEYGIKQHEAAQDAMRERDEARAEVERLKAELDEKSGHIADVERLIPYEDYISDKTCAENVEVVLRCAYQRGAEAMREAAILAVTDDYYHDAIRAIPTPKEEKKP